MDDELFAVEEHHPAFEHLQLSNDAHQTLFDELQLPNDDYQMPFAEHHLAFAELQKSFANLKIAGMPINAEWLVSVAPFRVSRNGNGRNIFGEDASAPQLYL